MFSWNTYVELFKLLKLIETEQHEMEWPCIISLLAIEATKHLENS